MTTPSHQAHREQAKPSIPCAVITVSDTRTEDTDKSGQLIRQMLEAEGHQTLAYHIIKDEPSQIRPLMIELLARKDLDAIVVNGGTGVAKRDVTFDVIQSLVEKPLPGFGELFRMFSYDEIGSAAMMSRAMAGTVAEKVIYSMPGSSGAVRLAMEKLVLPEIGHIVYELKK